jgi:hypothetical protein
VTLFAQRWSSVLAADVDVHQIWLSWSLDALVTLLEQRLGSSLAVEVDAHQIWLS